MNSDWPDEQLQEFLEKGSAAATPMPPATEKELQTYRLLYERLKDMGEEPAIGPSPGFALRVTQKITRRNRAAELLFYIGAAVVTLIAVALVYGLLVVLDSQNAARFALTVAKYGWVFMFMLICVLTVQWLDQRLLKLKNL